MEVLEVTSEDLVTRFVDRIDEKYDELVEELSDLEEILNELDFNGGNEKGFGDYDYNE